MSKPLIIFAKTYQEAKDYASLWGLKRKEISYISSPSQIVGVSGYRYIWLSSDIYNDNYPEFAEAIRRFEKYNFDIGEKK